MKNNCAHLNKAWGLICNKLDQNQERLISELELAMIADARIMVASDLNRIACFLEQLQKNDLAFKFIDTFIDLNIDRDDVFNEIVSNDLNWHQDLFFKFSVIRALNKEPKANEIAAILMKKELITDKNKKYLSEMTKQEWINFISEAEGEVLKSAIDHIELFDLHSGKLALTYIESRSQLNKIALDILRKKQLN